MLVTLKANQIYKSAILKEPVYLQHKTLVEQSKKGDRKAQFALYHQYVDAMFQISLRMLNNRADAEDILQESFVKAFKNLKQFKYESSFGAWLKKIVINNCINHLKKRKLNWIAIEDAQFDVSEETAENNQYQLPKIEQVKETIKQLPDGFRVVLTLYLFEGYDHKEISQILNISESTSKTQYYRAKNKLRQLIKV